MGWGICRDENFRWERKNGEDRINVLIFEEPPWDRGKRDWMIETVVEIPLVWLKAISGMPRLTP
jgi:hypothetical protein